MPDVIYQAFREGVNQKLVEQPDGTYASMYLAAPQVSLSTDVLYQVIREGVNKKLVLQPDNTYAEVVEIIGGTGEYQYVPYIMITVSQAGAGQVFINGNLSLYSNELDVDLFLNGARLYPVTDFSVVDSELTIDRMLSIGDIIVINSKVIPVVPPPINDYYLLENGVDFYQTEDGLNIYILES